MEENKTGKIYLLFFLEDTEFCFLRDANTNISYHIDDTKDEIINWYRINFLRKEADAIFNDRLLQLKSINKDKDKQLNLF